MLVARLQKPEHSLSYETVESSIFMILRPFTFELWASLFVLVMMSGIVDYA